MEVEKVKGGKERLVISEIPYTMIGANIGKFLNDVCALVESKKTTDIVDISNQSSKEGIRIVLELKKGADVEQLKNMLYKKTRLEDTFGVNMLAVAGGRPETLGLKAIIEHFLDFQFELTTRKYRTMLAKELDKKEIQEGLIKACDCIDLIIEILRGSKNIKQAKACLVDGVVEGIKFKTKKSAQDAKKLHFSEAQATAILEMRLYKLIGLEIEALEKEHEQTLKNIATYEDILENHSSMSNVIKKELDKIKKEYARPRKTVIENGKEAVYVEKKFEEAEVVFLMDRFGYCKCMDPGLYERNKETADAENKYVFRAMNTDKVCIFTDTGRMHQVKMIDVPMGKLRDKGVAVDNLCNYESKNEIMIYVNSLSNILKQKLLFATTTGFVKIVDGSEFDVGKRTIAATKLADDDKVSAVIDAQTAKNIIMQTKNGFFIRFAMDEVPEAKKTAQGAKGIALSDGDAVEKTFGAKRIDEETFIYKEKEVAINRIKLTKRNQKGTKLRV